MKLLTTIVLTFIVSVSAAQSKKNLKLIKNKNILDTVRLSDISTELWTGDRISNYTSFTGKTFFISPKFEPYAWVTVGDVLSKPILTMDRYPTNPNKEIESVTIHVNRSRTVWINDSTLVIKQK